MVLSAFLAVVLLVSPGLLYAERHTIWHVNQDRIAAGLPVLDAHYELSLIAGHRSQAVAKSCSGVVGGCLHHDLDFVMDRLDVLGIRYSAVGEILAWNRGYADPIATAERQFMESPPHRGVLFGHWRYIGAGTVEAPDGKWIVAILFVR
jgi:uncharacterized protein YkwD